MIGKLIMLTRKEGSSTSSMPHTTHCPFNPNAHLLSSPAAWMLIIFLSEIFHCSISLLTSGKLFILSLFQASSLWLYFTNSIIYLLFWDALVRSYRKEHNVNIINVTLDEMCVTKGPGLSWLLGVICGRDAKYDTVIINQLMYTFRDDGIVRNVRTNETWSWRKDLLPPPGGYPIALSILYKIGTLLKSLLAFILTSAVTALIVRVLMSSGVVLMFPVFYLLRYAGCRIDLHLLTLSYPWLGVPIDRLRAEGKPILPFIIAHLSQVLIMYSCYEASQLFWADFLYSKSVPSGLQFQIFGVVMLWEYYSMIFLRSALGIRFFPRVTLLYILIFHCK